MAMTCRVQSSAMIEAPKTVRIGSEEAGVEIKSHQSARKNMPPVQRSSNDKFRWLLRENRKKMKPIQIETSKDITVEG